MGKFIVDDRIKTGSRYIFILSYLLVICREIITIQYFLLEQPAQFVVAKAGSSPIFDKPLFGPEAEPFVDWRKVTGTVDNLTDQPD